MDVHGALDVLLRDPKPNHRTMINFYHSFSPEVERARRVFIFVYSRETSYQASRPVWEGAACSPLLPVLPCV